MVLRSSEGPVEDARDLLRHVLVAGPVEPVAADAVLTRHLGVDRVGVRGLGERLEERGVEDGHVGDVGEQRPRHLDAAHVTRVVQRCERDEPADVLDDGVVDHDGAREQAAALDDAVADGHDVRVLEARPLLGEQVEHDAQRRTVVRHVDRALRLAARDLVGHRALGRADLLDDARGHGLAADGVDQLVLDRRGAGVDDEDARGGAVAPV